MAGVEAKRKKWSRAIAWIVGLATVAPAIALGSNFIIQRSQDDKYFTINDHEFEARNRLCRLFEEGDPVIFITGDPEGRCLQAVIQNLSNGQSCEFWCRGEPYMR
jgi:hypothetical protein